MELQQFEMMEGVMASNKYIVVAKSEQTRVGIRAYVGPAPNIEHECISAGFKLRIEGTPVMIPSYKGSGGDHRSTILCEAHHAVTGHGPLGASRCRSRTRLMGR